MPYYIVLYNWTEQGIRNIKEAPKRTAAARAAIEKAGGKLLDRPRVQCPVDSLCFTLGGEPYY